MSDCILLRRGGKKKYIWNRYNVITNITYYWNRYTVSKGISFSSTLVSNQLPSKYRPFGGTKDYGLTYFYDPWSTNPSDLTTAFPSEYFIINDDGSLTSLNGDKYSSSIARNYQFDYSNNVFYKEFVFAYDDLEETYVDDDSRYWLYRFTATESTHNKYAKIYTHSKSIYIYLYSLTNSRGQFDSTVSYVNNSTAYPSNGISGSYWYVANGSTTDYYQGSYVDQIISEDRSTYPDNSYSGSYWYVYQGESGGSGSLKRILAG